LSLLRQISIHVATILTCLEAECKNVDLLVPVQIDKIGSLDLRTNS